MKWFKFEHQDEENNEEEISPILVYLGPEALKHSFVVDDFNSFQDTPECVPGGKFIEVSRQYSFKLRQVADLVEEPLKDEKLNLQKSSKRNFHEEIKPEKKLLNTNENKFDLSNQDTNVIDPTFLETDESEEKSFTTHDKLNTEQVPFEDPELLFVK